MKLMHKLFISMSMLALVGGVAACGGDDDDSGGSAAKLQSCKQFCDKQATASCPISLGADACKQICDAHAQAPAACQDALKALSDCQLALADACSASGCEMQETAYNQACGGTM
jgi:hypothetical protein